MTVTAEELEVEKQRALRKLTNAVTSVYYHLADEADITAAIEAGLQAARDDALIREKLAALGRQVP